MKRYIKLYINSISLFSTYTYRVSIYLPCYVGWWPGMLRSTIAAHYVSDLIARFYTRYYGVMSRRLCKNKTNLSTEQLYGENIVPGVVETIYLLLKLHGNLRSVQYLL